MAKPSQMWSKRMGSYRGIIHHYPHCYGVLNDNVLHQINKEQPTPFTNVFFQSRPIKIAGGFKHLRRMLLRSYLETKDGTAGAQPLFGVYLMVSLDGVSWARCDHKEVYGKVRDMVYLSSHFSAQYFMLLGAGAINPTSHITSVDVEVKQALEEELR